MLYEPFDAVKNERYFFTLSKQNKQGNIDKKAIDGYWSPSCPEIVKYEGEAIGYK